MGEIALTSSVQVVLTPFPSIRHEFIGNNWRAPFVDYRRRETLDRIIRSVAGSCVPEWKEWNGFFVC